MKEPRVVIKVERIYSFWSSPSKNGIELGPVSSKAVILPIPIRSPQAIVQAVIEIVNEILALEFRPPNNY
jgi:hypothetical protein